MVAMAGELFEVVLVLCPVKCLEAELNVAITGYRYRKSGFGNVSLFC